MEGHWPGGGVYRTRHLPKVSLIRTLGLVLFVANRLWPFIWVQHCHPAVFSLASLFQFRNPSFWPCSIRDNFSSVVLGWARCTQLNQPEHWFGTTCFQNTLFVFLAAVLACVALLCTTGRVRAKIPRATIFTKRCLSEAFLKWTKARSWETFRLLPQVAWIRSCNDNY